LRLIRMSSLFIQAGAVSMTSIHKEFIVHTPPDDVWAAVRDVGAVHQRLVPGLVVEAHLEGDARIVTFANGMVLRELIVTVDDIARRFVYASVGGRAAHHNASIQVFAEGENHSRIVWITDVLPDDLTPSIRVLVEHGSKIMMQTLEAQTTHG
jgi:carbon monoxide dehydrogenase subunit G